MNKKFTVSSFREFKEKGKKISMLTAYDYPTAKILDESGVHAILVGDSVGTVVLGYEETIKVTMEDMIHHIKAVARATKRAFLVGDLPFLSYHTGINESVKNAGRLVQEGGCKAVKLEGGEEVVEDVKAIINAGIPVMGHLGYTPQSINIFGGHKSQGKTFEVAKKIYQDALVLQEAGVFSIVLECVPYKLASFITKKLDIPIIGIGSGPDCDGQVLVVQDALGLDENFNPRHAKKYFNLGSVYKEVATKYVDEVDKGIFPTFENSFTVDDEVIKMLENN
jgi:3-methyl-2-oxobutanoate hydroxymethyltransferase